MCKFLVTAHRPCVEIIESSEIWGFVNDQISTTVPFTTKWHGEWSERLNGATNEIYWWDAVSSSRTPRPSKTGWLYRKEDSERAERVESPAMDTPHSFRTYRFSGPSDSTIARIFESPGENKLKDRPLW
jgi:hypothetical protein